VFVELNDLSRYIKASTDFFSLYEKEYTGILKTNICAR